MTCLRRKDPGAPQKRPGYKLAKKMDEDGHELVKLREYIFKIIKDNVDVGKLPDEKKNVQLSTANIKLIQEKIKLRLYECYNSS